MVLKLCAGNPGQIFTQAKLVHSLLLVVRSTSLPQLDCNPMSTDVFLKSSPPNILRFCGGPNIYATYFKF